MWAGIAALYALSVASLHGFALRNQQRPNPNSTVLMMLPAILLAGVLGVIFSFGVTIYGIARAVSLKESEYPDSDKKEIYPGNHD